jgi:hypothetical protein
VGFFPSENQQSELFELKEERKGSANLFNDGQHGLGLVGRGGRHGEAFWEVRVRHTHGVMPPHGSLFLRFAHDLCCPRAGVNNCEWDSRSRVQQRVDDDDGWGHGKDKMMLVRPGPDRAHKTAPTNETRSQRHARTDM